MLNQISDSQNYQDKVIYDDKVDDDVSHRAMDGNYALGWGKPQFVSNESLYKTTSVLQYLKDDCLFFQVNFKA